VVEVFKLLFVFLLMVAALKVTKLLYVAVGCAAVATALLFKLGAVNSFVISGKAIISPICTTTVLAFYFITFLQRMLEKRKKLARAEEALNGIFNNRRINAFLGPMIVGLLPAAGVVTIAGAMVDSAARDYLDVEEKTFVATYYRHVAESFLPTFPGILIAVKLAGVSLSSFLIGMIPVVALIILLGYILHLRKIPKETGNPPDSNRLKNVAIFFQSLWQIFTVVLLVIVFRLPVYLAVPLMVIPGIFIDRFKWTELREMVFSAFEAKLIISTVVIMIFKDLVIASGVITILPAIFSKLPFPSFLIYMLIVFLGSLISGQQAINVVIFPMAFAAGSGSGGGAGIPLFILLMTCGYGAMQLSPTHICLAIIVDYFKTSMGSLVKKTLPVVLILLVLVSLYYLLLRHFMS
jgi:integral membrane protein (TIGR00529 family)